MIEFLSVLGEGQLVGLELQQEVALQLSYLFLPFEMTHCEMVKCCMAMCAERRGTVKEQ